MARRRKKGGKKTKDTGDSLTHRPFHRIARGSVIQPAPETVTAPEPEPEAPSGEADDAAAYERAMAGVSRLEGGPELAPQAVGPKPLLSEVDEDSLVMRKLDALVHGETPFDFADTDEFVEAHVTGFDRRVVRRLKRGEFSIQAHLDLHGYNREQARIAVADFIRHCVREGKRCVLIITGRGIGSQDNIPVLKTKLAAWLTRGAVGRKVLAFTSARPYDGGTGAVYVLLRH